MCPNEQRKVIAGVLHQDGTLSIVDRSDSRRSYRLYDPYEVEIIRNAVSKATGPRIAQPHSICHSAGSHPTLEGSEKRGL